MQKGEAIVFKAEKNLITVYIAKGGYCYAIAGQDPRGPFCDEIEAYQELISELSKHLSEALCELTKAENQLAEIKLLCKDFNEPEY